jgi:RND family efflux transporter MFP subunit
VKILELEGGGTAETLEFPGTIEAAQSVALAFEVPGRLEELSALEGQEVEEGTVLARLDARDYRNELEAQQAMRNAAKAELDRTQKLFDEEVTSQQELDTKKRNYDVTAAKVEKARKALEDSELRAPFAGTIARVIVNNFETVQAKQPVILFENDAVFDVDVAVPEQDATRMSRGLSLEQRTELIRPRVRLSSVPGREFPARLTEFATAADPATRTFSATLQFENPGDVSIRSGMTAKIVVDVPSEISASRGIQVPTQAVVSSEAGESHVWVVDPQTMAVSRRPVELGEFTGDAVAVREGLDGDEWIATSGAHHLREGMIVRRLGQ